MLQWWRCGRGVAGGQVRQSRCGGGAGSHLSTQTPPPTQNGGVKDKFHHSPPQYRGWWGGSGGGRKVDWMWRRKKRSTSPMHTTSSPLHTSTLYAEGGWLAGWLDGWRLTDWMSGRVMDDWLNDWLNPSDSWASPSTTQKCSNKTKTTKIVEKDNGDKSKRMSQVFASSQYAIYQGSKVKAAMPGESMPVEKIIDKSKNKWIYI